MFKWIKKYAVALLIGCILGFATGIFFEKKTAKPATIVEIKKQKVKGKQNKANFEIDINQKDK